MWNETEHRIQTRRKGFLVQLSRKESVPWVKETRKVRVFQEKKSSRPATHCRRASVQKEILVIIAIRLSVPSLEKERHCKLGSRCLFTHAKKCRCEPKKLHDSVVVAETLDHTQAQDTVTSPEFIAKGDFLHGVSAIRVISFLKNVSNMVKTFRLARVAQRFCESARLNGPTFGHCTTRCTKRSTSECSVVPASGSFADFIEANMKFAHKNAQEYFFESKGLMFKHVKNSSDLPTGQLKRKLSQLGQIVNVNIQTLFWEAAHL